MFSDRVLLVNTLTKSKLRPISYFKLPFIVKRNVKKRFKMAVFGTLFKTSDLLLVNIDVRRLLSVKCMLSPRCILSQTETLSQNDDSVKICFHQYKHLGQRTFVHPDICSEMHNISRFYICRTFFLMELPACSSID